MNLSLIIPVPPLTLVSKLIDGLPNNIEIGFPLGTSLIALPTDIAEMLNTQIGAKRSWNGQYTVDCSKVPELPDLTFHFGGKPYPLKGTDYILNVQGTCVSSFTPMDINLPGGGSIWVVGECLRHCRTACVSGANSILCR
jgi:saccharopepsin